MQPESTVLAWCPSWIGVERVSASVVGWFGLRPLAHSPLEVELGYRLNPEFWGCGLATEAAAALVEHAVDSARVQQVFGTTMIANIGSWIYDGPGPIPGAENGRR